MIKIDEYKDSYEQIIENHKFSFTINSKDLNLFSIIIRTFSKNEISLVKYLSKKLNFKFRMINTPLKKAFIEKNFVLLFIYVLKNFDDFGTSNDNVLEKLYIIIFELKKNYPSIIDNNDIFEIIYFNILLTLNHYNNSKESNNKKGENYISFFNSSFSFLLNLFNCEDFTEPLSKYLNFFDTLFNLIEKNEKLIHFFRNNVSNIAVIQEIKNKCKNEKLVNSINKILSFLYSFNFNKSFIEYLLSNMKKHFCLLGENYSISKIIKSVNDLNYDIDFLKDLLDIEKEQSKINDLDVFMPFYYFKFQDSKKGGITYDSNYPLTKNDFTIIFSFKTFVSEKDVSYPLLSFYHQSEKESNEIIFSLYIKNNQLYCYFENKYKDFVTKKIENNKSYLIVLEYSKVSYRNDKLKIHINNEEIKIITRGKIKYSDNSLCSIGYFPENKLAEQDFRKTNNYNGIIGSLLFFNGFIGEGGFVKKLFEIKGCYEAIINLNPDILYYTHNNINKKINDEIKDYFIGITDKLNESLVFYLSPVSIIQKNKTKEDNNNLYFIQNVYCKYNSIQNNNNIGGYFSLNKESKIYSYDNYASEVNNKLLDNFIKYDGLSILSLYLECFYNTLRMIIKNEKEKIKDDKITDIFHCINNTLNSIFKFVYRIGEYFVEEKIDIGKLMNDLDTFGFSLKKTLSLLITISPFDSALQKNIITLVSGLNKLYFNSKNENEKQNLYALISKIFKLICFYKLYNLTNFKEIPELFKLFKDVLKENKSLICSEIIYSILDFSLILDVQLFIKLYFKDNKISSGLKNNLEYKYMIKEYKLLLSIIIGLISDLDLYIQLLNGIFSVNSRIAQYKLLKLFYINNNIKFCFGINDIEKNNQKLNNFFGFFKNNKNNIENINENIFLIEYKKQLKLLISLKESDENIKKYIELQKCILIQLIYNHVILILSPILGINYLKINFDYSNNSPKILFYAFKKKENKDQVFDNINIDAESVSSKKSKLTDYQFSSISNEINNLDSMIDDKSDSSSDKNVISLQMSSNNKTVKHYEKKKSVDDKIDVILPVNDTEIILFNSLIEKKISENESNEECDLSFYILKSLFFCLQENLDKKYKLKFIKFEDNSYESFSMVPTNFNKFKKVLLFQFVGLLEYINNNIVLENITKFIFAMLEQIITIHKSNKYDDGTKRMFIHLFESKKIMFNLTNFLIHKFILLPKQSDFSKITEIFLYNLVNTLLLHHPDPFIFSYIRFCVGSKTKNDYISKIIINISEFILNVLNENKKVNMGNISYFYYNIFRFLKTLNKIFEKNKIETQTLLSEKKFNLFYAIQDFLLEFTKNGIIYDSRLYTYNSEILEKIYTKDTSEKKQLKMDKKRDIKLLELAETKIINKDTLFILTTELFLELIYLLWTINNLNKIDNNNNEIIEQTSKIITDFFSNFYEHIFFEGHFISYYIDLHNPTLTYKQNKKHENMIRDTPKNISLFIDKSNKIKPQYKKFLLNNLYLRDIRILSVEIFCIFMKYQTMIVNYEQSLTNDNKTDMAENVKFFFNKYVEGAQNDAAQILQNISKFQEDKVFEVFIEKVKNTNKSWVKNFNDNYYKYYLNTVIKNSLYFTSNVLKNEIEKKYLADLEKSSVLFENNLNNHSDNIIDENSMMIYKSYNERCKDSFSNFEKSNDTNDIFSVKENNDEQINKETNNYNFTDAEFPILCTKRDLILKKLGYYFYKFYFYDITFLKTKKRFLSLYPPKIFTNSYYNLEKQMSLDYPSTMKNFFNEETYYPRLFLRPDKNFFDDFFFKISHEYCEKLNPALFAPNNNKPNFNYGHGLLNQKDFELFTVEKYNPENIYDNCNDNFYEVELLCFNNNYRGKIKLGKNSMIFQSEVDFDFKKYTKDIKYIISSKIEEISKNEKQVIISYKIISQIILRKFVYFKQAVEVFLKNGKSYFFNIFTEALCNEFITKIEEKKNDAINFEIIKEPQEYFLKKKFTSNWLDKKITTLDYLLLINKYSGRSYNDTAQYLILPWILKDYRDINNKSNIRQLDMPMAVQNEKCLQIVIENYSSEMDYQKSYFKCHYSNSSYVCIYLFRTNPFSNNQIKLQGEKFDSPNRQLETLQDLCKIFKDHKETCELVPEYFFMPEILLNLNYNYYGIKTKETPEKLINNYKLEKDFKNLLDLITFQQNFLNSGEISENINKWIDNIFGENQLTDKPNVINSYPFECYEQNMKEKIQKKFNLFSSSDAKKKSVIMDEIKTSLLYAYLLGQCPTQIFTKAHPQLHIKKEKEKISSKFPNYLDNLKTKKNDKIICEILYMGESDGKENYYYILTKKEILIYNKLMKLIKNISLELNLELFIDDDNNDLSNQFIYKNLIFEIEDCKYFFICGFFDNSYKFFYKNKEKTIKYSFITESLVTCIKKIRCTNEFLTGHIDGRLVKWKYNLMSNKEKCVSIIKLSNFIGHKSCINIIEINEKLNIIITIANNEGNIFVRKLFDYELLTVISYNQIHRKIIDAIFDKMFLVVTYHNKTKESKQIYIYSVNGIKLNKKTMSKEEDIYLPISIYSETNEIIMITKNNMYITNINFDREFPIILSDENKNNKNISYINSYSEDLKTSSLLSYFYDFAQQVLFSLFENGQLYRVNIKKNNI